MKDENDEGITENGFIEKGAVTPKTGGQLSLLNIVNFEAH